MTHYDKKSLVPTDSGELSDTSFFQSIKTPTESLEFPLRTTVLGTSEDPDHYRHINISRETQIPLPPHPGAFGVVRKFHTHEGVDLYCDDGAPVFALESGTIVAIENFTGVAADSPWWCDTKSLLVEGQAGVVCYGEIEPEAQLQVGDSVTRGQLLGAVKMVLKKDKGRPRSMLHIELHLPGTSKTSPWQHGDGRPATLLDPTELLIAAARNRGEDLQT
jgi:murein DD-endopeptidase MepM/ murein hydrolase activator NlpD